MKKTSLQILKACSLSVALLGSVAVVAAVSMPDMAFAKSGNDNGGGNGNGNGNGGGNGKSEKSGGSNGKSEKSGGGDGAKAKEKAKEKAKAKPKAKAKAKPKKKDLASELGVHPSELGALNAARANENAFKNAAPNSRVGRIAAYRDAVLDGQELEATLAEKQAELGDLEQPSESSAAIKTQLDLAVDETNTAAGIVSDLEAQLGNTDPEDTDAIGAINGQLVTARADLTAAEMAEAELQADYDNAVAYETLNAEIAELVQKLEDQPELEESLLKAAANKEVTPEVEAAVKLLLGL